MSKLSKEPIQIKIDNLIKSRMPSFAFKFFKYQKEKLTPESLYGYVVDMSAFFEFISDKNHYSIKDMTMKDFESISEDDIEEYLIESETCNYYGEIRNRSIAAIRRRYAVLHTFYMFYYTNDLIKSIPILKVNQPKQPKLRTSVPSQEDAIELIRFIETGSLPTSHAAAYQESVRVRDTALAVLLICVGLKASECVNLNITDLHLEESYITIKNKKRSKDIYISNQTTFYLSRYLEKRLYKVPEYGHYDAFFLSLQGKRLSMDAVEDLIRKYSTALFGPDCKYAPKDYNMLFRENIFYSSKNIYTTAEFTRCHPYTIFNNFKADAIEFENNKSENIIIYD